MSKGEETLECMKDIDGNQPFSVLHQRSRVRVGRGVGGVLILLMPVVWVGGICGVS